MTPRVICEELKANARPCFDLLINGFLGLTDPEEVFDSPHLQNNVASIISLGARLANRKSTGFALQLTTAARDGGLREDTIKLLPSLLHPRTSQKHDSTVMAKDWDASFQQCLKEERSHFEALMEALRKLKLCEESQVYVLQERCKL